MNDLLTVQSRALVEPKCWGVSFKDNSVSLYRSKKQNSLKKQNPRLLPQLPHSWNRPEMWVTPVMWLPTESSSEALKVPEANHLIKQEFPSREVQVGRAWHAF